VPPPLEPADAAAWREFVAAWQDRIYSLARRVLGDPGLAADATQEVFVAIWRRRDSFDRSRPVAPWVYGIAMNALRGSLRGERRRRRREREAAVIGRAERLGRGEAPGQDEELAIVDRHFAELPAEARALLALHYQHGLSQREIARTLGWRRGAVQTRLSAALERLRGALGRNGHLALIPALEGTLRRGGIEAAPAPLREALLAVPHGAAAAGLVGGGVLGGVLMAKLGPAAIAAVAVVSVAIGLGAGRVLTGGGGAEESAREAERLRGRIAELERAAEEAAGTESALAARLAAAEARGAEAETRAERLAAEVASLREGAAAAPAVAGDAAAAESETIDWAALASAFDENSALILRLGEILAAGKDPGLELSREEREALRGLQLLWRDAAEIARRGAEHPFLEPEILPPLLASLLGGPLDLTESQLEQLTATSDALLAEWTAAREGTPLEAWQARRAVWQGIGAELDSLLTAEQQGVWGQLRPAAEGLLQPSAREFSFGLEGQVGIPDRLVEEWRSHYGIAPDQERRFLEVLADYDRGAREIMVRHLGENGSIESLSAAARRALEDDYLDWQLRSERQIIGLLGPEQLAELRERIPAVWQFEPGGRTSISINDGASF